MTSPTNYNTVILDIEGTITPITFVKEVLVSLLKALIVSS